MYHLICLLRNIRVRRGSLMINSNMWNIKAGDTRLRLLLLGTDGLPQEVEEQILVAIGIVLVRRPMSL